MSLIIPSIGAFGHTASGVGDGTRRKLVSVSNSAATGMRYAFSSSVFSSDTMTISFWWKKSSTNISKTIWASHTGQYQIYTGSSTASQQDKIAARMNGTTQVSLLDGGTSDGTWIFVYASFGIDHNGTIDVYASVDDGVGGFDSGNVTNGTASSDDLTAAHTQYFICDDNAGGASDDGFIGEIFDMCVFDGYIAIGNMQHDGSGNWQDLSATAKAALVVRYDGQSSTNAGLDTSGNGFHATVENSGITVSATGLPSGA